MGGEAVGGDGTMPAAVTVSVAMLADGCGGGGQPIDSQSINTSAYTVFGIRHLFILLIYRKLSATAIITVGTTEDRMRHFH